MMKYRIVNIKNLSDSQFDSAFEKMSEERKAKCLRYKFLEDRRRMAFGEDALRNLICEAYAVSENEVTIKSLPSGKPVATAKGKEVFVSISHSDDFVACAVSDTPVGIDLEAKREVKPSLFKALKADELRFLKENEDESSAFLKIWTAKEAYLKITGEGLAGLDKAEVLPFILKGFSDSLKAETNHTHQYFCTIIYEA